MKKGTWIALGIAAFIVVVLIIASLIQNSGSTEELNKLLNTPLSEVKFWHFLLGTGLVISFFGSSCSRK
jgi:hypothetical protein